MMQLPDATVHGGPYAIARSHTAYDRSRIRHAWALGGMALKKRICLPALLAGRSSASSRAQWLLASTMSIPVGLALLIEVHRRSMLFIHGR